MIERHDGIVRFARGLEMSEECNPVAVQFANNLRRSRELLGISQEELAFISYLPRAVVSLLEEGEHEPLVGTVICLAIGLAVPIEDLLRGIKLEVERLSGDCLDLPSPSTDLFTE